MSDYFRKPMKIRCEWDGKIRTVSVKCHTYDGSFAADTFFSVPAATRFRGRYIHGYVTGADDGEREFRAHDACRAYLPCTIGNGSAA